MDSVLDDVFCNFCNLIFAAFTPMGEVSDHATIRDGVAFTVKFTLRSMAAFMPAYALIKCPLLLLHKGIMSASIDP